MQLSIIIVNYNVKLYLQQCLYSVMQAITGLQAEVIVIDNASTDNSEHYFEQKFSTVKFFWQADNAGFARANNLGLQHATGNLILYLNPDTILPNDGLKKCVAFMAANERCGALGVKMLDGYGEFLPESKRGLPVVSASFFKMTGIAKLFTKSRWVNAYYAGHVNENQTHIVDVLSGAFMLVRKKIADELGGFDERYFMYAEDIDLSYAITQAGYFNYYFPEVTIVHFKGESTQKLHADYAKRFYGAMDLFVQKYYTGIKAWSLRRSIQTAKLVAQFKSLKKPAVLSAKHNTEVVLQIVGSIEPAQVMVCFKQPGKQYKIIASPAVRSALACAEMLQETRPDIVLFCVPQVLFETCIDVMQRTKYKPAFYWFNTDEQSMVGPGFTASL